jgi:hypothetical protein
MDGHYLEFPIAHLLVNIGRMKQSFNPDVAKVYIDRGVFRNN